MKTPRTRELAEGDHRRQAALLLTCCAVVAVLRLTSGEYAYAIHDLTGIDPEVGIDAASDSVGGEGFTSFGDVQFMQDSNLERYLAAAKIVANHAVIGAGPIEFFADPGKTGFELSAITRVKNIYAT